MAFTIDVPVRFRDQAGRLVARARTVIVAYDFVAGGSRPLGDGERAGLEAAMPENPMPENPMPENPMPENPVPENPVPENPVRRVAHEG